MNCTNGVREGHAATRSRCYAGQGQVVYAPVAEWLRADAIRASWKNLGTRQMAELARLIPEVREQCPAEPGQPSALAESWQRLNLYESLNAAFGKTRKPILLYLDDMQWCDPDSFEWLLAFLTASAGPGVLALEQYAPRRRVANTRLRGFWPPFGNKGSLRKSRWRLWMRRRLPNWRASNHRKLLKAGGWQRSSRPRGAIPYLSSRLCARDCRAHA